MSPESLSEYAKPESLNVNEPTVVYYASNEDRYSQKNAIIPVLKNDLGCQVLALSFEFGESCYNNQKMNFLFKKGSIVAFIMEESSWDEFAGEPRYPEEYVELIHNLSPDVPFIFIGHDYNDPQKYQHLIDNGAISTGSSYGEKMFSLIEERLKNFSPKKPNYFGVETWDDFESITNDIYQSYQPEENGVSSFNDQIILQALRIHLLNNGESVEGIFDEKLKQSPNPEELDIEIETIEKEKEIIRQMSSDQRFEFKSFYLNCQNERDLVNGFAIDPETLENITTGRREHYLAKINLANRLTRSDRNYIDILVRRTNLFEEADKIGKKIENRLISGFIYHNVPDFSSPVLIIRDCYLEGSEYKKVANFLNKQNYIPIDENGDLIE